MPSDDHPGVKIRPVIPADRPAVAEIVSAVGNFKPVEIDCALELVDICLQNRNQEDYRVAVAERSDGEVMGYACWGPVPLTAGTYDLYWIATHPRAHGLGFGRALMAFVENCVRGERGRLLVLETSAKKSYENTVRFYRGLGYEEISRIPDFYDVGDDKLTFLKRLTP